MSVKRDSFVITQISNDAMRFCLPTFRPMSQLQIVTKARRSRRNGHRAKRQTSATCRSRIKTTSGDAEQVRPVPSRVQPPHQSCDKTRVTWTTICRIIEPTAAEFQLRPRALNYTIIQSFVLLPCTTIRRDNQCASITFQQPFSICRRRMLARTNAVRRPWNVVSAKRRSGFDVLRLQVPRCAIVRARPVAPPSTSTFARGYWRSHDGDTFSLLVGRKVCCKAVDGSLFCHRAWLSAADSGRQ